jgi:hypothetical protein
MRTAFGSKRHHYVARASIFLIMVALIGGMVGCGGGVGAHYDLTVASTAGGSVTNPGEGTFPYDEGEIVDLVEEAEEGYRFVEWSGDVDTIADVNNASTTITMNSDYSITANFVRAYDPTMAVNPVGGGTATDLTNASPYAAGTSVSIAAAAASGYRFVNWTAPAGTFADANAARTIFTMPAQNVIVTANFLTAYGLTVAADPVEWGIATDATDASPYAAGTVVNITAVAGDGYVFVNWKAPAGKFLDENAAQTTFTMPAQDVTVIATFAPVFPPLAVWNIVATPTKIGNAAVITWYTNVPTTHNIVVYGQSSPPRTTSYSGSDNVDKHAVVISGLTPNSTYYYQVTSTYLGSNCASNVSTFAAQNAKNAWDGSKYTVNMLITLAWDVPSASDTFLTTWFTNTESYIAQAAQYIYDATDGYIRLGRVIVVDSQEKGNALWQTSDMTFEDKDDPTTPVDDRYRSEGGANPYSYYYSRWNHTPAIENTSRGVGMQFGKIGGVRGEEWSWNSAQNGSFYQSGWQARIITHEFGHYALYLPDRYDRDGQTNNYSKWDQNWIFDSDLMSARGYWVGSTYRYYTEFGAKNCSQKGYSDCFGEGNIWNVPPLWLDYSSWYIIINPDPFAGSGIPHYSNAHGGVEPAYPDPGPTNENGGVFDVIFINN